MAIVFFDMDGVLTEWNQGVVELFGRNWDEVLKDWPPEVYMIEDVLKVSPEEVWDKIDKTGIEFWAGLKQCNEAKELWDFSLSLGFDTYILSNPSSTHTIYSVPGKIRWLRRFTGDQEFNRTYFSSHKDLLAREDRILIDDYDNNVKKFKAAGGKTILMPRRWNSLYRVEKFATLMVKRQLAAFGSENRTGTLDHPIEPNACPEG